MLPLLLAILSNAPLGHASPCQGMDGCTCFDPASAQCQGLSAIPDTVPSGVNLVAFDDCDFPLLEVLPESYSGISQLFIRSSRVANISDGAFENLARLQVLDLRGNQLRTLHPGMFRGMAELSSLHLSNNDLQLLPEGLFANLPSLVRLDLSVNYHITFSPGSLYIEESELMEINLSDCSLTALPEALSDVPSLNSLELKSNNFTRLEEDTFDPVKNSELSVLQLDDCNLDFVHEDAFSGLSELESVSLSTNRLSYIPRQTFQPCWETIERVSLDNNRFENLPDDLLPWFKLSEIRLARNPWYCDCGMSWMSKVGELESVMEDNIT